MHGLFLADSAPSSPTEWGAISIGLLTLIYIVFIRPMKAKKNKDPLARAPGTSMLSQQRAIEQDMTALLVEYEQMMRRMTAQIDTRSAKLETLLQEADRVLTDLRAEAASAGDRGAAQSTTPREEPARPAKRRPQSQRHLPEPSAESTDGRSDADESADGSAASVPDEAEVAPPPARPNEDDPLRREDPPPHADVYDLADSGLSYRQIAQQLDRAYGEIELILALRGGKRNPKRGTPAPATEGKLVERTESRAGDEDGS